LTLIHFLLIAFAILAIGGVFTAVIRKARRLLTEQSKTSWSKTGRTLRRFGQNGTNISLLTKDLVAPPYKIYMTDFDIEISAQKLCEEFYGNDEAFSNKQKQLKELVAKSANLAHLPSSMKKSDDLFVTLLVDHSGSLTGDALQHLVLAVDRATNQISGSKIAFEILGFTTRSWKGGSSRKLWVSNGKPESPGRLSDLMYIVYKDASENYAAVRPHMTVMLEDDIRRENIDGEALLWAHSRFKKSEKKKWVCIVLSDGAPVDDSTLSANIGSILEDHLQSTIRNFETNPDLNVFGFGIGNHLGRYYRHFVQVENAQDLVEKLTMEVMKQILSNSVHAD
jgi:cobaltochelatase CobT